jgi:hypothetical protein
MDLFGYTLVSFFLFLRIGNGIDVGICSLV